MPREDIRIDKRKLGIKVQFSKRIKELLDDPQPILKGIGHLLLGDSQRAFQAQEFGGESWPGRYPNMGDPFINIAGAVSDLQQGTTIKARRFQSSPALRDTGMLLRSLKNQSRALRLVSSHVIEVGTTVPYAHHHQWGVPSTQQITPAIKKNLKKVLKQKAKKDAKKRLGFLLKKRELTTNVGQRPFLGIQPKTEKKILQLVTSFFKRKDPQE